jgi:hypothetical protein
MLEEEAWLLADELLEDELLDGSLDEELLEDELDLLDEFSLEELLDEELLEEVLLLDELELSELVFVTDELLVIVELEESGLEAEEEVLPLAHPAMIKEDTKSNDSFSLVDTVFLLSICFYSQQVSNYILMMM